MPGTIQVRAFHNISRCTYVDGYTHGEPLVQVASWEVAPEVVRLDLKQIAENAFDLLNIGDDPDFGTPDLRAVEYRARHNRDLSKGDVLQIRGTWMACASSGWDDIPEPELIVRLTCHGTEPDATA